MKKARIAIVAVALLGLLAAIYAIYLASQQVPEFYAKELSVPPSSQEKDSDLLLVQGTNLQNDLHRIGRWRQVFKAETINAWLAVDLPRNFPTLLSPGMHEPRVHVGPEGIKMACKVDRGAFHCVISLEISAFVASDDVVGLRIHDARLGAIPWSLRSVLDVITDAAKKSNADIRWRQANSDPVALIRFTSAQGNGKRVIHIDTIRLEEGSMEVAGTTETAK